MEICSIVFLSLRKSQEILTFLLNAHNTHIYVHLPGGSDSKASAYNEADLGSISGSGKSPGEGNGNPLPYSSLENPMDRGAWRATVHGVARDGRSLVTKPPPPGV